MNLPVIYVHIYLLGIFKTICPTLHCHKKLTCFLGNLRTESTNPGLSKLSSEEMSFSSNSAFAVSRKETYLPTDDSVTNKISQMHIKK